MTKEMKTLNKILGVLKKNGFNILSGGEKVYIVNLLNERKEDLELKRMEKEFVSDIIEDIDKEIHNLKNNLEKEKMKFDAERVLLEEKIRKRMENLEEIKNLKK